MALYLHRFSGRCAAGDQFNYSWRVDSIRTIDAAHSAAVVWNQTLWNGATAGNGYKDHCTADVAMNLVETSEFELLNGHLLRKRSTGQLIAGVAGGNALPADCCVVVSLRSELPRRSGRGRFYLPQPSAGSVTLDGRVAADLINDTLAALTAAWGAYNTGVDRPSIYSKSPVPIMRPIVSFNIPDSFGTQRRRENKVGDVRTTATMP